MTRYIDPLVTNIRRAMVNSAGNDGQNFSDGLDALDALLAQRDRYCEALNRVRECALSDDLPQARRLTEIDCIALTALRGMP